VSSIRIAFVASTFEVGGAERVVSEMIRRLDPARFNSQLYFLRNAGTIGRELLDSGVTGVENLQRGRIDPIAVVRLGDCFRRDRPDVVFCLDHHNAMLWGRIAGLLAGAKALIVASHSTGLYGRRGSFRRSDRMMMRFTRCVVALSETHAAYLRDTEGIDPARIRIVENGIDTERYAKPEGSRSEVREQFGLTPNDEVVIMVAALRPEKAHETLLAAASKLRNGRPNLRCLIVGDGDRRGELEAMSRRLALDGIVQFLGQRADIDRLLRASDVLVLPSKPVVETLPLCVLEAMAAGVPVVASRVGSVPDLVRDQETGVLIAPADPGELAAGIDYTLGDRSRSAAMAEAARKLVVERYGVGRMVRDYETLFEEMAA